MTIESMKELTKIKASLPESRRSLLNKAQWQRKSLDPGVGLTLAGLRLAERLIGRMLGEGPDKK